MDLNKPDPFTPKKNQISKEWRVWKEGFLIYLKLSGGYENYTEEERALLLLNLMGPEAIKAMEKMSFDDPSEKDDMDILIMKFDEIFDPPPNEILERYKFFTRTKGEKEDIENYVADLKEKATKCNFGLQTEKLIIDMIIRNMDKEYQQVIFGLKDITLPDIIQQYKKYNISNEKMKELSINMKKSLSSRNSEGIVDVGNVDQFKQRKFRNCSRCGTQHIQKPCPADGNICSVCNEKNHFDNFCKKMSTGSVKNDEIKPKRICSKCGTNHPFKECPAYDEICRKCFTKGHYTSKCKQKEIPAKEINTVSDDTKKESENANSINFNPKHNETYCKPSSNKLEDCRWCESKHVQGQCPHNAICTRCDQFPHNICFQCKNNPHDNNCYYKTVITLPEIPVCSVPRNGKCYKCHTFGHLPEQCPLYRNFPTTQNVNLGTNTADPLLRDYVTVGSRQQSSNATPQHKAQQMNSKPYFNKSQYGKSNDKRKNEKPDTCNIS